MHARRYCAPGNLSRTENPPGVLTARVTMTNGRPRRDTREVLAREKAPVDWNKHGGSSLTLAIRGEGDQRSSLVVRPRHIHEDAALS